MEQIKELEEVLELLNTKQYTKLRQYLAELNDADIAGLLEELEEEEMLKVFRILPKDLAADVFSYLDMDNQQKIITSLSDKEARRPREMMNACGITCREKPWYGELIPISNYSNTFLLTSKTNMESPCI